MGRTAQLCMGPAGSGKTTFCEALEKQMRDLGRSVTLVNLDPAAEDLKYNPHIDVRNLISLNESTSLKLGPNGGLVFCMEYLATHLSWLRDEINQAAPTDDEYLIIDCPGQIELYTHVPAIKVISRALENWGIFVCGTFLVDSAMVVGDTGKYLSAVMLATSAMISIEIPWLNILSKFDLIDKEEADVYCNVDFAILQDHLKASSALRRTRLGERLNKLNQTVFNLLEDFSMVSFVQILMVVVDSLLFEE